MKRQKRASAKRLRFESLEPRKVLSSTPLITEFMASNSSTLLDGDGNSSDWVEVHNPTASTVDLDGWFLTDDAADLNKWAFPAVTLVPNDYLIVFASAPTDVAGNVLDNYTDAAGNYHANFRIDADGEYLAFTTDDGLGGQVVVSEFAPEFPPQLTDVSYGVNQSISTVELVSADTGVATALVPTDGALDAPSPEQPPSWTLDGFNDSTWLTTAPDGGTGVGFDVGDDDNDEDPPPSDADGLILPGGPLGGDLTDPEDDGTLAGTITVGNPNSPGGEEPPKALDNLISTKWLSLEPNGTTFQFRFNAGPQQVRAYTITSANDATERDPFSWTLNGSNDGANFTVIDARSNRDFTSRFETQLFGFDNQTAYQYYRFDFQTELGATGSNSTVAIQLAEIELFDELSINPDGSVLLGGLVGNDLTDPENDGSLAGVFSVGNANSPAGEEPARALDNTTGTKWLSFAPAGTSYEFRFDGGQRLVNAYTITSANDAPDRDPYSWTLSGSNDGANYTIVDTRDAIDFVNRFETQRFDFDNSAAYEYYKFDFLTEFGVTGANQPVAIQLAEIELLDDGAIDFSALIALDVESQMTANPTSVYERIEFTSGDPAAFSALTLNMQYDDGFAAYLNGVKIASAGAPASVNFNSNAASERPNQRAIAVQSFDVSAHLSQLTSGTNVLAIHGLNVADDSEDLLIRAGLVATEVVDEQFVPGYYINPTPGAVNNIGVVGLTADPTFSVQRGFYDAPFQLQIDTTTPGADVFYTTNGSEPTTSTGTLYTGPITIAETTTLRAGAFKANHISSAIGTQTYLFVDDVVRQDYQATLDAGFPTYWGGVAPDYGIDADVIGNFDANGNPIGGDLYGGVYANTIKDDLRAIPTLSIVMETDDLFGAGGIYTTPTASGVAWERATSVELLNPDGSQGFQVDAGIRIQGGAFRRHDLSRKHSLRLLFKGEYGPTKLDFPLFGDGTTDGAVASFDTITLRMDSNDGWAWNSAGNQAQYARDEFGRRTQLALGQPSSHGTRVHLYINGIYWGLYNPIERPDASFSASYYGGDKSQWDALNAGDIVDGTGDSWNTLRNLAQAVRNGGTEASRTAAYMFMQGKNADGTDHATAEDYLDVDNYIDYLIINFYGGNVDWPHRNWFASRQRGPESTGYKFHIWDMESALGLLSDVNTNRIGVNTHVAEPYDDLRSSAEFRLRFADRVHRALFNDGPLTTQNAAERYQAIVAEIDEAIVAESARWGDMHFSTPRTKANWANETASVLNNFVAGRSGVLLNQLKSAGLYSSVDAPTFSQRGGQVAAGFDLSLSNPNGSGVVYYTTDGTDPRLIGDAVSASASAYSGPIEIHSAATIKTRVLDGGVWSAIDEAAFTVASPADATNLRITELNFNPHDAVLDAGELDVDSDEFEFVELQNIGAADIDLAGVQFVEVPVGGGVDGIEFTFSQRTLAPGEFVLLVENQAAFESRYGLGLNIAGQYSGKLANNGEMITLLAADASMIQQFAYNDAWQPAADGLGRSLVVIDVDGDYNSASNWRASATIGGTPDAAEAVAPGDFNIDGTVDEQDLGLWELGFGTTTGATTSSGDADADGDVDGRDFLAWQRNVGNAPSSNSTPGDFNDDGNVNGADLPLWETGYGVQSAATPSAGDADADRDVDGRDFLIWQRNVNVSTSAATITSNNAWIASLSLLSRAEAVDEALSQWAIPERPVRHATTILDTTARSHSQPPAMRISRVRQPDAASQQLSPLDAAFGEHFATRRDPWERLNKAAT